MYILLTSIIVLILFCILLVCYSKSAEQRKKLVVLTIILLIIGGLLGFQEFGAPHVMRRRFEASVTEMKIGDLTEVGVIEKLNEELSKQNEASHVLALSKDNGVVIVEVELKDTIFPSGTAFLQAGGEYVYLGAIVLALIESGYIDAEFQELHVIMSGDIDKTISQDWEEMLEVIDRINLLSR